MVIPTKGFLRPRQRFPIRGPLGLPVPWTSRSMASPSHSGTRDLHRNSQTRTPTGGPLTPQAASATPLRCRPAFCSSGTSAFQVPARSPRLEAVVVAEAPDLPALELDEDRK